MNYWPKRFWIQLLRRDVLSLFGSLLVVGFSSQAVRAEDPPSKGVTTPLKNSSIRDGGEKSKAKLANEPVVPVASRTVENKASENKQTESEIALDSVGAVAAAPNPQLEEMMSISSSEPIVEAYGLVFLPRSSKTPKLDHPVVGESVDLKHLDAEWEGDAKPENDNEMRVEKRTTRIVKGQGLQWELYVVLNTTDRRPGAKLSAIASSSSGKVLGLRVRELVPMIHRAGLAISCNPEKIDDQMQRLVMLPLDRLKDLAEIRRKKRSLLLEKLADMLNASTLQRIKDAETSAGIFGEPQISARLGPSVIARRLVSIAGIVNMERKADLDDPAKHVLRKDDSDQMELGEAGLDKPVAIAK